MRLDKFLKLSRIDVYKRQDQINLSEKLVDEERIIVPAKGEANETDETSHAASAVQSKKININNCLLYTSRCV